MDITSVTYFLFVGISLLIYWKVPTKCQWIVLLADSLVFYFMNAASYTFIYLLFSVVSVYIASGVFEKENSDAGKKAALILTLAANIGILAVLKYSNLAITSINFAFGKSIPHTAWAAPPAISFYTLQITAYLLNCYWGVTYREKNVLKLLLFTSFFPLMISGPISSHQKLGSQFFEEHRFDYERVVSGLRRAAWGVAKKAVVADRAVIPVNYMFNNPDLFSGIWVFAAAAGFTVVLYFDFSGCMDIVIGVSKCFGITLEENFNAPFLSRTVQEIWQRWHITLGGWLKSFVMYPILKSDSFVRLGTNCRRKFGKSGRRIPTYIAMLAVWLLMGLWHGSSWKYIIGEGLWFWIIITAGQILEPAFKKQKKALHIKDTNIFWRAFQTVRTVLLFSIGMIFFNAASLTSAFYMISRAVVPTGIDQPLRQLYLGAWGSFGGTAAFIAAAAIGLLQVFCEIKTYHGKSAQENVAEMPFVIRWGSYFALIFIIIIGGNFGKSSFIYFGF